VQCAAIDPREHGGGRRVEAFGVLGGREKPAVVGPAALELREALLERLDAIGDVSGADELARLFERIVSASMTPRGCPPSTTGRHSLGCSIPHVTARWSVAIGVASAAVLAFGVLPAAPASKGRTPPELYRALRTKPFAPATVAGRFSAARLSTVSPSPTAARYRAIGAVQVMFRKGEGSIHYTVFRSHTAAFNSWAHDVTAATTPGLTYEQRLHVYGLPVMAVMFLGALGGCDPSTCPPTRATFVSGVVQADVTVTVRSNASNYDQVDASALTRAAYAHLRSLS
jgi:hypothetical protein